jgi:hypothetical protein
MNEKLTLDDYTIGEKFITPGRTITDPILLPSQAYPVIITHCIQILLMLKRQSLASALHTAC